MSDTSKASYYSPYSAFKNNIVYSGSCTISGSSSAGANVQIFSVALSTSPDMVDVSFNGPAAFNGASDPRPGNGWFRQGTVWVRGDNAAAGYTNYPTAWEIFSYISGSTLYILAVFSQQFTDGLTLTSTNFSYRVVDYSVF